MQICNECEKCIARMVCGVGVELKGFRCNDFHDAFVSKLQSVAPHNKQSESLLCGKCVKDAIKVQTIEDKGYCVMCGERVE